MPPLKKGFDTPPRFLYADPEIESQPQLGPSKGETVDHATMAKQAERLHRLSEDESILLIKALSVLTGYAESRTDAPSEWADDARALLRKIQGWS